MKKIIFAVCFLMICFSATQAQIYHLSLDESIEIAKKQNYEIQNLLQEKIIAENTLKATTARLKTRVDLSLNLPQYNETVQQWQDSLGISFFPVKTLKGSGSLSIQQPLPTDGTITVSSTLDLTNDYRNERRASQLFSGIYLNQPLEAFWGYNSIRADLKRAKLNYESTNKSLKRTELDLIYNVSSSFYRLLLLQKTSEIASMNLERLTEAYGISKNKYEAGLIREVEYLQNEVELARAQNNYEVAVLDFKSSTNSFKRVIGLELDATVTLKSEMDNYAVVTVDSEKAVDMALKNRLEIKDREIQIELQKIQVNNQRSQGRPAAYLNASFERRGTSNIDLSETYSSSLSDSWDNLKVRPSSYMVGLSIRIPIIDMGRNKSQVKVAEARLKQSLLGKEDQERGIEVEVRNLVASLQTTLKQLQLLEQSVSIAEKSYDIMLQRYSDGDISSQDLTLERNRLNDTQQSHLRALVDYQLALADLMRKTFYDFENDVPIE